MRKIKSIGVSIRDRYSLLQILGIVVATILYLLTAGGFSVAIIEAASLLSAAIGLCGLMLAMWTVIYVACVALIIE